MKKYFLQLIALFAMALLGEAIFFYSLSTNKVLSKVKPKTTTSTVVYIHESAAMQKNDLPLINELKKQKYSIISYDLPTKKTATFEVAVTEWTKDLNKLVGNKKVIVIGHSLGGSVATHFCSIDKRCIAGVNLDGVPAFDEKLSIPFLYLQTEKNMICDASCKQGRALMTKIASGSGKAEVKILGAATYNATNSAIKDDQEIINKQIIAFLQKTINKKSK